MNVNSFGQRIRGLWSTKGVVGLLVLFCVGLWALLELVGNLQTFKDILPAIMWAVRSPVFPLLLIFLSACLLHRAADTAATNIQASEAAALTRMRSLTATVETALAKYEERADQLVEEFQRHAEDIKAAADPVHLHRAVGISEGLERARRNFQRMDAGWAEIQRSVANGTLPLSAHDNPVETWRENIQQLDEDLTDMLGEPARLRVPRDTAPSSLPEAPGEEHLQTAAAQKLRVIYFEHARLVEAFEKAQQRSRRLITQFYGRHR